MVGPFPGELMKFIVPIALVIMFLASAIRVLNEYERAVVFRLGRIRDVKGPGLIIIIPIIDTRRRHCHRRNPAACQCRERNP